MSIPVDLERLRRQVEDYGPVAFLLTAGPEGRPHCVQLAVSWSEDGALVVHPGRGTLANVGAQPLVSLLWPPVEEGGYSLIVDGAATGGESGQVRVHATKAVLHRPAKADDAEGVAHGSDCVRVFAAPAVD